MTPYYREDEGNVSWRITAGDCREVMRDMEPDSIDAVVCDPPYGLSFMARDWDHSVPGPEYWRAVLRVAKPGAHLLAFGGTRTYHRLTCAIEDAGWEIRDCLQWLYGSGFPKSHNVPVAIDKAAGAMGDRGHGFNTAGRIPGVRYDGEAGAEKAHEGITPDAKRWQGWGTALKPAWEPVILARKPFKGSVADNVLKHGTGALNIDGCRIAGEKPQVTQGINSTGTGYRIAKERRISGEPTEGRWPANLVLDETAADMLDAQSGDITSGKMYPTQVENKRDILRHDRFGGYTTSETYGDTGGASRFFYTSKASREEREGGLDGRDPIEVTDGRRVPPDNAYQRGATRRRNVHPTVKPLDLMRWLVRLVTPPGGTVLDPFAGSGTTIMAARIEGFNGIGIEIEPEHAEIARKRAAYAGELAGNATPEDAETMGKPTQLGLL